MNDDDSQQVDPYQSPALDAILLEEPARPLTRAERAVLNLYLEHRDRPFTMMTLIWRMIPNWCLIAVMVTAILIFVFGIFPGDAQMPRFVFVGLCGGLVGAVVRDVGVARRLVMMWPLLRGIFDWTKLESMLENRH